jgi:hypothetical protein
MKEMICKENRMAIWELSSQLGFALDDNNNNDNSEDGQVAAAQAFVGRRLPTPHCQSSPRGL